MRFPNLKVVRFIVVVWFLLATVAATLGAVGHFALGPLFASPWVGFGFFLVIIGIAFVLIRYLATDTELLYPREASALEFLGGAAVGPLKSRLLTGQSATWPFGKLAATRDRLKVYTPWETFEFSRHTEVKLTRVRGFSGCGIAFSGVATDSPKKVTLWLLPWQVQPLARALSALGYEVGDL